MKLANKIALVTGASQGIGLACAQRFVREGARDAARGTRRLRVRSIGAAGAHPPILGLHLASRAPPGAFA